MDADVKAEFTAVREEITVLQAGVERVHGRTQDLEREILDSREQQRVFHAEQMRAFQDVIQRLDVRETVADLQLKLTAALGRIAALEATQRRS